MNYEIKKLENSTVEITIKVEGIAAKKEAIVAKLANEVELPGFRKGHVPASKITSEFGDKINTELADEIIKEHYENIINESGIKPVDYIFGKEINVDGDNFEGVFAVDVYPEFELGTYKGLEGSKETFEMTDELLNTELETVLSQSASLEDAGDDHAAKMGDTVDLAFEGFVNGVAFAGGQADSHTLKLGSKMFIDNFEEQLVGYKKGQEGEINVTFPEQYHSDELAGKEAMFKVKINNIQKEVMAELNDEFAKEKGYESLADMKEKKKEEVTKREEQRIADTNRNTLLQNLSAGTEMTLPKSMIMRESNARIAEMEEQLKRQGLDLNSYLQMTGMTKEAMLAQVTPMAEERVKTDLILNKIAEVEGIEVSPEELEKKMADIATMYGMELDGLKEELKKAGNEEPFKENMKIECLMNKTIDFIAANAK